MHAHRRTDHASTGPRRARRTGALGAGLTLVLALALAACGGGGGTGGSGNPNLTTPAPLDEETTNTTDMNETGGETTQ